MKVTIDNDGDYSTIGVYLDNGEEIGRYEIVEDPKGEAASMRKMLRAVVIEARSPYRDVLEAIASPLTTADYGNGWAVETARRALNEAP